MSNDNRFNCDDTTDHFREWEKSMRGSRMSDRMKGALLIGGMATSGAFFLATIAFPGWPESLFEGKKSRAAAPSFETPEQKANQEILIKQVASPILELVNTHSGQTSFFLKSKEKEIDLTVNLYNKTKAKTVGLGDVYSATAIVSNDQGVEASFILVSNRLSSSAGNSFAVSCFGPDHKIYSSAENSDSIARLRGPEPKGEEPYISPNPKRAAECAATITADIVAAAQTA